MCVICVEVDIKDWNYSRKNIKLDQMHFIDMGPLSMNSGFNVAAKRN